jgi:hypothetical protein
MVHGDHSSSNEPGQHQPGAVVEPGALALSGSPLLLSAVVILLIYTEHLSRHHSSAEPQLAVLHAARSLRCWFQLPLHSE